MPRDSLHSIVMSVWKESGHWRKRWAVVLIVSMNPFRLNRVVQVE